LLGFRDSNTKTKSSTCYIRIAKICLSEVSFAKNSTLENSAIEIGTTEVRKLYFM
jgi:hypothetical protein